MIARTGFLLQAALCTIVAGQALGANGLIDPTRPPTAISPAPSRKATATRQIWVLESTVVAADRRVAVINGKLVAEGDTVDGARVVQIRALDVLVQTPDRRIALQLLPDIVKPNP